MEGRAEEGTGLAETDRAFHATSAEDCRGLGNVCSWGETPEAVSSGDSVRTEHAIREHFDNIHTRAGPTQQFSTNGRPN